MAPTCGQPCRWPHPVSDFGVAPSHRCFLAFIWSGNQELSPRDHEVISETYLQGQDQKKKKPSEKWELHSKATLIRSTRTLSKSLYQKNASPTLSSPPQRFSHILIPLLLLASTMQKHSSQSNPPKDCKLQRSPNHSHLLYLTNSQLWHHGLWA